MWSGTTGVGWAGRTSQNMVFEFYRACGSGAWAGFYVNTLVTATFPNSLRASWWFEFRSIGMVHGEKACEGEVGVEGVGVLRLRAASLR